MVPAPRIPALEPPYDPEIARTLERMMGGSGREPLLLFRVVAHNPNVLDKFRSSGSYLLNFGTIDPIEREIVIDRTCARCRSEYEWGVHVVVYGRRVGLSDEQIRATVVGTAESPEWTERQATLIRLADELHDTGGVSDDLWAQLQAGWSAAQLVELLALVGQYHMVAYFTNAIRLPLEAYAQYFPQVVPS